MKLQNALSLLALLPLAATYPVNPPTTAPSDTIQDCTNWVVAKDGDTCQKLADPNFITVAQLTTYNPSLAGSGCPIIVGDSYCIEQNYGIPPPTTTSPTTTPGNGVSTPTPTQDGMVSNCNKFHLVASGDTCAKIASANGISVDDLYKWNPGVKTDCTALWAKYYVCVGLVGQTPPTSTAPGNGVTTPTPTQDGMVSNCNQFHLVASGDTCAKIASGSGIALDDLYKWNPGVKSDCSALWASYYVCVGLIGGPTHTPPPPSNGIATPTPTQDGMTGSCNAFHKVVSGDTCAAIAAAAGIGLDDLYAWNPAVKSDCSALWASYYICVGIIGGPTHTPTSSRPGNGIATPTPTQDGMVDSCSGFHKVVAGDGCADLAAAAGISLDSFYAWNPAVKSDCAGLWLGYYVCTSIIGGPTSTSTSGNGIPTPTPTQPGMVGNCNKFYKVQSGDNCENIISSSHISSDDFYRWNPNVGLDCKSLWLGYYVCVGTQ